MRAIREAYIGQCREAGKHAYADSLAQIAENTAGIQGRISNIFLYPGKALGPLEVDEAIITQFGLMSPHGLHDRSFMLGKKSGKTGPGDAMYERFSQRQMAELSLVKPIHHDAEWLVYEAPGMRELEIDLPALLDRGNPAQETVTVEPVPGTVVEAIRENGIITARLREFIRQFRADADTIDVLLPSFRYKREVENKHRRYQSAQTYFTDGGQMLLASESSLAFVQQFINAKQGAGARQIPIPVLRPNFVVAEWPMHLEDILDNAQIAGTMNDVQQKFDLLFGDLSVRCKVTQVDLMSGTFAADREPFDTFLEQRPLRLDGNKAPTAAVNTVFPLLMWDGRIKKNAVITAGTEKRMA